MNKSFKQRNKEYLEFLKNDPFYQKRWDSDLPASFCKAFEYLTVFQVEIRALAQDVDEEDKVVHSFTTTFKDNLNFIKTLQIECDKAFDKKDLTIKAHLSKVYKVLNDIQDNLLEEWSGYFTFEYNFEYDSETDALESQESMNIGIDIVIKYD